MPAVRDSKHNSLSASTETGTRQGRVNPDEWWMIIADCARHGGTEEFLPLLQL